MLSIVLSSGSHGHATLAFPHAGEEPGLEGSGYVPFPSQHPAARCSAATAFSALLGKLEAAQPRQEALGWESGGLGLFPGLPLTSWQTLGTSLPFSRPQSAPSMG